MSDKLIVITSLDVEEEGLFSGSYPRKKLAVSNVSQLPILGPLSLDLGFPLTLFCTYSVFANAEAAKTVGWMKERCGAEIGAHLHHWSTPPYLENESEKPERTDKMPEDLFISRLDSLLKAGKSFLGEPLRVFRMGRWDLKSRLLPILAGHGIKVDSSVNPLRAFRAGPNHFDAPADPYWVEFADGSRILEAPITQISLFPGLARMWQKIGSKNQKMLDSFHFFGALSVNPFWHGEKIMRLAVRLHKARGGRVIIRKFQLIHTVKARHRTELLLFV